MISDQERLDKCEHTSPMKTGREGYIGRERRRRDYPFGPDELVTCYGPGDACCYGFEQFRKELRIHRSNLQLFKLLAFLAASRFFNDRAFRHFQCRTFGAA